MRAAIELQSMMSSIPGFINITSVPVNYDIRSKLSCSGEY